MSLVIKQGETQVASTAQPTKPKQEKDEPIVKPESKADKLKAVASVAASLNKQYDTKLSPKVGEGEGGCSHSLDPYLSPDAR